MHEISSKGRGRPRHALGTVDENITDVGRSAIPMAVDEAADTGKLGKQVVGHAVVAGYVKVITLADDLLVPGLVPVDPSSIQKRDHGGDVVLPKNITSTRT